LTVDRIHLVATGGTIDKRYDPLSGNLYVGDPVLPQILASAGLSGNALSVSAILRKDSLEITDSEREEIAAFIAALPARRIVVTHGTDTMSASAARIATLSAGQTIVLTGAMIPWSIANSDASFNVGIAYAAAQCLPAGVYIAMHGAVHPHAQYIKDRTQGRFIAR